MSGGSGASKLAFTKPGPLLVNGHEPGQGVGANPVKPEEEDKETTPPRGNPGELAAITADLANTPVRD